MTTGNNRAKRYSNIKYAFALFSTAYLVILLFLFLGLGLSSNLSEEISKMTQNRYLALSLYLAVIFALYAILDFPFNLYRSFRVEHKFGLSRQKFSSWLADNIKTGMISYIISLIVLAAFYFVLEAFAANWWLVISAIWIFLSLILAKLMPIVIIPLFFKYRRMDDQALRQGIISLAKKMKLKILDVFEIDFSKKTLKANAALLGWGSTRRVILADTLKDKYSKEEIEAILAHEFAHYRQRHLLKIILINSSATLLLFFLIFKSAAGLLPVFGLDSLSQTAALPLVFIYFVIFGLLMQPLENYFTRCMERSADRIALEVTGAKGAFISMMEKLANQNLADRAPNLLIKLFFFDHPPIDERIKMAQNHKGA